MTPEEKYNKIVAEVNNALFIISGNAELTLTQETLSREGKKRQETIKEQVLRINKLLERRD